MQQKEQLEWTLFKRSQKGKKRAKIKLAIPVQFYVPVLCPWREEAEGVCGMTAALFYGGQSISG
jgi:hypothetical protein